MEFSIEYYDQDSWQNRNGNENIFVISPTAITIKEFKENNKASISEQSTALLYAISYEKVRIGDNKTINKWVNLTDQDLLSTVQSHRFTKHIKFIEGKHTFTT